MCYPTQTRRQMTRTFQTLILVSGNINLQPVIDEVCLCVVYQLKDNTFLFQGALTLLSNEISE